MQWDGEQGVNSLGDSPFVPMVAFHHTFFIRDGVEIGDFRPAPHRGAYWISVENIKDWVKNASRHSQNACVKYLKDNKVVIF